MKVAILFGSDTGKTESVARLLQAQFPGSALLSVFKTEGADLGVYDLVLVGTSTWGTGALADCWNRRLPSFPAGCLAGKLVGFFGLGDRIAFAETFCQAVTTLTRRFGPQARVLDPPLLIDDDNNGEQTAGLVTAWAQRIKGEALGNR